MSSIAVIMSAFNEEASIEQSLDALDSQTVAARVIVVDGGSSDRTPEILRARAERDERLLVHIDGRYRTLPEALNLAIDMADEEFVAKVDARTFLDPRFLEHALATFEHEGSRVACVGGRPEQRGETPFGRALAYARTSKFGVGGSGYASTSYGDVDTVQCGIYRRAAVLAVGGFDSELQFGEDEELNWRLIRAGWRIVCDPRVRFRYLTRSTWQAAFRQYRNYGRARGLVIRKHPEFMRARHLIPSAAVLTGAVVLLLAPRSRTARRIGLGLGAAYAAGALGAAAVATRGRLKDVPLVAAAFSALHAGYGVGLLQSPLARKPRASAREGTKVVHLSTVHDPSDMRITYKECATLAESGYEVVLIAPGELPNVPPGVRFRSVPLPSSRLERSTRTMWSVYRAALDECADVYHFHDPELMFVGMLLQRTGARVVFDVHEDIPGDIEDKPWIPTRLRKPVSIASAVALAAFHHTFDAIVTATPAIARRFNHKHMAVVNNYPRIEEFGELVGPPFGERPRRAVYVGSITLIRCIDRIVDALDRPELGEGIGLALAGRFEDEPLEARITRMPGWSRVEYFGFQQRGGVHRLLEQSRVGLLLFRPGTNIDEALPTKLFEYLAAGLPVIVSTSLQCSRLVTQADCGIAVDSADTSAIARAITSLVDDPQRAQAMGERGRRLVLDGYVWESEAAKLTRLYAEISRR